MRTLPLVLALAALGSVGAPPAPAQVKSTIVGPGVTRYPIAVAPLKQIAGGSGERFTTVLTRDLELSGLFRVLPRDAYIESAQTAGVTAEAINFENWSVIGALALLKGTAERQGNDLTIEARLFDVGQRRQLAGRRFRGVVGDERRMANRFADEVIATFTGERGPFDSQIAFLSTRGGRFKDVYVMGADGEDVRRVTNENTLNLSPSWAPDGRSLVLTSFRDGNPDLYAIGLGRGSWSRLSALRGLNLGGRWSPDGRQIAVTIEFDGNPEIAILNPDGSLARRLTEHWAVDVSASWSPDGTQLVFCSDRAGSPQIYVMGGGRRRCPPRQQHRALQHLAQLVAEGGPHRLRDAGRGTLPDHDGEGRRLRSAPGDVGGQQRGSGLVAGWSLPDVQLEARRRGEAVPVRPVRREPSRIDHRRRR